MGRKIKFRVWHKDTKKMYEVLILGDEYVEAKHCTQPVLMEHVELMQGTGLKDLNGVEIYEGDIVESDYYEPDFSESAVVGYDESEMRFCFNNKSGDLNGEQDAFVYGNLKVIGNIHQNPEILRDQ